MVSGPLLAGQFDTGEVTLSYVMGPANGPPVVLIHGVASRWQPFQPILPTLMEKYQVYALDLRGHGRSGHTPGAYRLADYARDVHHFIVEQVNSSPSIYGHSLGALVSIYTTALHPDCVRALILGEPPLYYHHTPIENSIWHAAFTDLLNFMEEYPDPAEMDAWLIQNAPGMSAERRKERIRSLEGLDADLVRAVISNTLMEGVHLPALLPRVSCPVLLLRGNPTLGSILSERDVDFSKSHFPNVRVLKMETVGHGIIPVDLLPQAIAFLDAALGGG